MVQAENWREICCIYALSQDKTQTIVQSLGSLACEHHHLTQPVPNPQVTHGVYLIKKTMRIVPGEQSPMETSEMLDRMVCI